MVARKSHRLGIIVASQPTASALGMASAIQPYQYIGGPSPLRGRCNQKYILPTAGCQVKSGQLSRSYTVYRSVNAMPNVNTKVLVRVADFDVPIARELSSSDNRSSTSKVRVMIRSLENRWRHAPHQTRTTRSRPGRRLATCARRHLPPTRAAATNTNRPEGGRCPSL